jgi:hypothetical protein
MREFTDALKEVAREAIMMSRQRTGVLIQKLKWGDELLIRTVDAEYQCTIADAPKGVVVIMCTDGSFTGASVVRLVGSCVLTNPLIIRAGWLGHGYPVFIEGICTSPLQRLELNGEILLPWLPPEKAN